MLTIERVKKLLGDPVITDEMAEAIRYQFRALVEDIIFEAWLEEHNKLKQKHDHTNIE